MTHPYNSRIISTGDVTDYFLDLDQYQQVFVLQKGDKEEEWHLRAIYCSSHHIFHIGNKMVQIMRHHHLFGDNKVFVFIVR